MNSALSIAAKILVCILLVAAASEADAQKLYRYRDANGVWVYTDRQPGGEQEFQEQQVQRRFEAPEVRLLERSLRNGVALIAQNTYFAPIQIGFRLRAIENVSPDTPRQGIQVLPPRSETELLVVGKSAENIELRCRTHNQHEARLYFARPDWDVGSTAAAGS